ncbi:MAG: cystathionine gamma-synthase, partial [Candidatus Dormibacteraceae bacterium]
MNGFETRAIHVGQIPDQLTGAVIPPLTLSTTFAQDEVGQTRAGYDYGRSGNPSRSSLEQAVAALESASHGYAFASGMAAIDTVLQLVKANDHVIIPHDAYGGTFRLIDKVHQPHGLRYSSVDLQDRRALEQAWQENTQLVWIETPTNPTLSIVDIAAVADFAHARQALVVVDNTFATPYLQRPIELGADIVVHSLTKYLGGHSDVVGGFVALNDAALAERIAFLQNAIGAVLPPFDCYLVQRGLKTLAIRMDRHNQNAQAVVDLLVNHPAVDTVLYPSLPSHPYHEVASRQMHGYGGMISFTLHGGEAAALRVVTRTKLFTLAESLGAVESLIEHPRRMTHLSSAGSSMEVDPA